MTSFVLNLVAGAEAKSLLEEALGTVGGGLLGEGGQVPPIVFFFFFLITLEPRVD